MRLIRPLLAASIAAVLLAACGGGTDSPSKVKSEGVVETSTTTALPATTTTAPPATTTTLKAAVTTTTAKPVTTTTAAPATTTTTAAPPTTVTTAVYYANCDAARAAGVAPIMQGQPGYRSGLDRDGDGIACDK